MNHFTRDGRNLPHHERAAQHQRNRDKFLARFREITAAGEVPTTAGIAADIGTSRSNALYIRDGLVAGGVIAWPTPITRGGRRPGSRAPSIAPARKNPGPVRPGEATPDRRKRDILIRRIWRGIQRTKRGHATAPRYAPSLDAFQARTAILLGGQITSVIDPDRTRHAPNEEDDE